MSEKKNLVKTKNTLPKEVRIKSFFAGVRKHFNDKKKKLITYLKSDNFQVPKDSILKILLNGLLFTVGLSYFIGFSYILIPITGCGWYIFKKEILPELRGLISSINLVRITK